MNQAEVNRFSELYQRHQRLLKLQGKSKKTIDAYARAVRRINQQFDRRGKGHKDRFVPLPDLTYQALRALWCKHRNPCWLFPSAVGSPEQIRSATTHMDRGGTQAAMKVVLEQCGIKKKSRFTP